MLDERHLMRQVEETRELREVFVTPVYLSLLHANFISRSDAQTSKRKVIADLANAITDDQIGTLLRIREWRGRLTVAWYVGLRGRSLFIDEIGELLLKSELTYAGQGYCIALGLIGDDLCKHYLREYLRKYLPMGTRFFDQMWAIGALAYCDKEMATEFLNGELWSDGGAAWDPASSVRRFEEITAYLREQRMIA